MANFWERIGQNNAARLIAAYDADPGSFRDPAAIQQLRGALQTVGRDIPPGMQMVLDQNEASKKKERAQMMALAALPIAGAAFAPELFASGAGAAAAGDAAIAGGEGFSALASEGAGEAALGSGLGTGSTASGIGGGGLGTGLTAGGASAAGIGEGALGTGVTAGGAATAGSAFAPGYFAGESLYPVTGGASAAATGASAAAGGRTAFSRILNGTATTDDWLSVGGAAAPALLGAYASNKQTGALENLANKYAEYGAPSRGRYEASMTPGFDPSSIPGYSGAVDTASKSILAKLSASGGNPFGNPGGLIDAQKQIISGTALPAVNEYQRLNAATGFGQTLTSAGGYDQNAIGSQGNFYNAVGAGINDVTNPPKTLADQLAEYEKARRTIGGGAYSLS